MKYLIPFMLFVFLASVAFADSQQGELKLTGTVRRVMAIGGETTGWALVLDFETAADGMVFREIELDPGDTKMEQYKNQHVEVTGTLFDKTGVERGKYTVFQIRSIKME
ncbi:MAG: hypothetical protein ACYDFU_07180 [Nitrospirota bacterium]